MAKSNPVRRYAALPWEKADKDLIELLEKSLEKYPCDRRVMFGSPTFFTSDNMFAGVHQHTVILRLSDTDRAALYAAHEEAGPFTPMPGRPMKEYAALPASLCKNSTVFNDFLKRSYDYALSLPPKPVMRKKQRNY
jgi:TfoX/Sxy family transcriptional regulator of competence genes